MKIAVCSDLHLEFGDVDLVNTENAEVLILGGDIFVAEELKHLEPPLVNGVLMPSSIHTRARCYRSFVERCCERFAHVILVTGNHEHYYGDWNHTHTTIRGAFGDLHNLHVLDKEHAVIDGVVFYGGTLWTDMNAQDPITMWQMQNTMNDYYQIKNTAPAAGGKFLPQDSVADHFAFRQGLDQVLAQYELMPVVVVGHHAPSKASTHPRYKTEFHMNGAYSTNMDDFILDRRQIRLWTHGHTHEPFDYCIGGCRIVCNPRGYDGYEDRADNFELVYVEI